MLFNNQNTEALNLTFIRRITLVFAFVCISSRVEILNLEASTHNIITAAGVVSKFEPFVLRRFYDKLQLIAELNIKFRF